MRAGPYRPGPLVWCAILFGTCTLLFLFQKILWLVVPFLFGLIGYYLLFPLQQRLVLGGMSRDASAALVSGGTLAMALGLSVNAMPWMASRFSSWQEMVMLYVEGGLRFAADTVVWLERSYSFVGRLHLSNQWDKYLAEMGGLGGLGEKLAGSYLGDVALTVVAWLPSLLLAPFLTFFFLRDGWRFKKFLTNAVPNAFFERTLYLLDQVDNTARLYFQGLIKLTVLDSVCLAAGLSMLGVSAPVVLGLATAVLAWVPYIGSVFGCLLVVLVAATDYPGDPGVAYGAIGLFVIVRLLDDFLFMPLTIGKSLKLHPLLTVLMILVGGEVAGVAGLMLVLPLLGVVMVLGETAGQIITDPRLKARHAHATALRHRQVTADLQL